MSVLVIFSHFLLYLLNFCFAGYFIDLLVQLVLQSVLPHPLFISTPAP